MQVLNPSVESNVRLNGPFAAYCILWIFCCIICSIIIAERLKLCRTLADDLHDASSQLRVHLFLRSMALKACHRRCFRECGLPARGGC